MKREMHLWEFTLKMLFSSGKKTRKWVLKDLSSDTQSNKIQPHSKKPTQTFHVTETEKTRKHVDLSGLVEGFSLAS